MMLAQSQNYKWVGNKTEVEQMIGNAVPVNLAKFVAKIVKTVVEAKNGN